MVNGMRDDIWLKKDLNLQKAFADGDFGLLMDYSDENQKNLMNQWMNREASFMNKMLRFGSTVLHRFENGLQNEQQLYAVFRMGALLGTVEGFEQIIYEKAQGEWFMKIQARSIFNETFKRNNTGASIIWCYEPF